MSFMAVSRWMNKFGSGKLMVKVGPNTGRKTISGHVCRLKQKVKARIKEDVRYSVSNISRYVGISLGSAYTIMKRKTLKNSKRLLQDGSLICLHQSRRENKYNVQMNCLKGILNTLDEILRTL